MRALILSDWELVGSIRRPVFQQAYGFSHAAYDGPGEIAVCEVELDTSARQSVRADSRFAIIDETNWDGISAWSKARNQAPELIKAAVERILAAKEQAAEIAQPAPLPPDAFPCRHRGEVLRVDRCNLCGIRGLPFDVYECKLPEIGECSISKRHSGIKSCIGCPHRQEPAVEPVPIPDTLTNKLPRAPARIPPANLKLITDHEGRAAEGWENRFRGGQAFLICGGPSLLSLDLELLNQRGILTAAVNNAAAVYRPHLWFSVDTPAHFCPQILGDPGIHKFLTIKRAKKSIRRLRGRHWIKTGEVVASLPNVWFFEQANGFDPQKFLSSRRVSWGTKETVGRCVLFCALRLLFWMGVRTLYLLGADFRMEKSRPYAFDELQNENLCAFNNRKYEIVNDLLTQAGPHFAELGFRVFNCSAESVLTAFPRLDFETAVRQALEAAQITKAPQTRGLYVQ